MSLFRIYHYSLLCKKPVNLKCTCSRDARPDLWLMSLGRPLLKLIGAVPNCITKELERTVYKLPKNTSLIACIQLDTIHVIDPHVFQNMKTVFTVRSGPSENYHASLVPALDMGIL